MFNVRMSPDNHNISKDINVNSINELVIILVNELNKGSFKISNGDQAKTFFLAKKSRKVYNF
jgi:hypothetical protein